MCTALAHLAEPEIAACSQPGSATLGQFAPALGSRLRSLALTLVALAPVKLLAH